METITISKFKSTCLMLLEKIKNTQEPLLVTKRGLPIALVTPPPTPEKEKSAFGCMKNSIRIKGDIVSPLPQEEWKVLSR
ncbi:MAG: type II toxin-antitoxin system Phd/YefM family antitoxin [Deltaproteobacteria bacterium]|nr:type II toxin-antitoxin system Phd/YefM family antitoxin [Deltaproteobacteria bacterium]